MFYTFQSWVAAFTETFLTWGILGACTMQITSHNRPKHLLHRDASLVVILTLAVLILAAFLANTCVQLLETHGYVYLPSSFGKSFYIPLFWLMSISTLLRIKCILNCMPLSYCYINGTETFKYFIRIIPILSQTKHLKRL